MNRNKYLLTIQKIPAYLKYYFAKERSILPHEYQEVEYIKSTGTQYINLGIKGTNNTKVDIDIQTTDIESTDIDDGIFFLPFGARSTASSDCFAIWSANRKVGGNLRIGFDSTNGYSGGIITLNTRYHIIHSKDGTYVNNELVWSTDSTRNFTTPQNLLVFGYYASSSRYELSSNTLYHLKLWENNVMVRNFIPCYRKSDGEIGLYDIVNNEFYTNSGTGTFLKGSNVNQILPDIYQ